MSNLLFESIFLLAAFLLVISVHRLREGQVLLDISSGEVKVRRRPGYYFRIPGLMPCVKIELSTALRPGQILVDEDLVRTLSESWRNDATLKKRLSNEHSGRKAILVLSTLCFVIGIFGLIDGSIVIPYEGRPGNQVSRGTEAIVASIVFILLGLGGLHDASRREGLSRD